MPVSHLQSTVLPEPWGNLRIPGWRRHTQFSFAALRLQEKAFEKAEDEQLQLPLTEAGAGEGAQASDGDALLGDVSMDGPPSLWKQKGGIAQAFTVDEIRAYEEVLLQVEKEEELESEVEHTLQMFARKVLQSRHVFIYL